MATFTGTQSDDTFTATSSPDTFYFGENEGVDLIFKFDTTQDKLAYTDRSVDGFDDLEITRLQNGDAVIESNDQYTVLQGVDPNSLVDSDFVFTTSGPRGTISDSRSSARRPPDEVDVHDVQRREQAAGYPTGSSSTGLAGGGSSSRGLGGLLGLFGNRFAGLFGFGAGRTSHILGSDGSRTANITAPGQIVDSSSFDTAQNNGQRDTTFVFQPGHGAGVIEQFRAGGGGHDTLSLPQSDFTGIADVLRNTQASASGAVIHDPTTGDTVRLPGVSRAELVQNRRDIAFHG